MADARGLLDTSVVLDHDLLDPALLPDEAARDTKDFSGLEDVLRVEVI